MSDPGIYYHMVAMLSGKLPQAMFLKLNPYIVQIRELRHEYLVRQLCSYAMRQLQGSAMASTIWRWWVLLCAVKKGLGLGDHEVWVENVAFASKGAVLTCWDLRLRCPESHIRDNALI
jgi:hypothetical protein